MTRKRIGGFRFETYKGDHPPFHVHIWKGNEWIGRWDIEHQKPMDSFPLDKKLSKALAQGGYLLGEVTSQ